jgi:U4/U6 small nuclear ribonucleoprotein PRP31
MPADADYDNEDDEEDVEMEEQVDEQGEGAEAEAEGESEGVVVQGEILMIPCEGGQKLRQFVEGKLEKLQEPDKARTKKALPIPEEKKKARRGGKRIRKMKEKLGMTDLRRQQNQLRMTVTEGEYGESAMGLDQGNVGSNESGSGRIRAPKKTQQNSKLLTTKKVLASAKSLSSGATGGMSSSLVFTPVQGLELVNPNAAADRVKEANQKWFNAQSGFLSAVPKTS